MDFIIIIFLRIKSDNDEMDIECCHDMFLPSLFLGRKNIKGDPNTSWK